MYKRSEQGWLKHLDFILLDILCAQLAFVLSYGWRFGFRRLVYDEIIYRNLAIWMAVFDLVIAVMFNTMHDVLKRRWATELRQTFTQSLLVFGTIVVYLFSVKESEQYSRQVLWTTLFIYMNFSFGTRMVWKRLMRRWLRIGHRRTMLLIAPADSASEAIKHIKAHPLEGLELCGVVLIDRDEIGGDLESVPIVANMDNTVQYICREWIDEVFVSVTVLNQQIYTLLEQCREMGVTVHLHMLALGEGKQIVERVAGMPVLTSSINLISPVEMIVKRLVDLVGGIILSLLALIAIAIFGPIIKHASPGPVLYSQERIGQNGRRFKMYKIRSMVMDADMRKDTLMDQNVMTEGLMFKMAFDPRVIGNLVMPDGTKKTGVGEFIRKYSIDELPQAFNLLLGNMSLVGTRPPTVDEWEKYELHHRARLAIKPGITGMWQVQGRNKITDFEEITKLDTYYITNWSFALDARILFKTVLVVLQRKGAM